MPSNFGTPQRQSPIGLLVMLGYTLQQYGRAFFPLLVIWLWRSEGKNQLYYFIGFGGALLVALVVAWLRFRNFTFYIDTDNEEFIITDGVLNKTKTVIQLNKIQQVNIGQSLLQRIVGVYALEVDTAGSNQKEGKIRAISHDLALALKERLLENEKPLPQDPDSEFSELEIPAPEQPFIKISLSSLLKIGITSNYLRTIGVIIAFFLTVFENIRHVVDTDRLKESDIDNFFVQNMVLKTILSGVLVLLVAVLVVNVLRVLLRYFNYEITRQKGSLLLSFGLVNTKSTIIKPEKVQITTVSQNYFQKRMDIFQLRIKQAASGETEQQSSAIEIPGCNRAETDAVLEMLFKSIPEKGLMLRPNYRKLVFSLFLSIVLPLGLAYVFVPSDMTRQFLWAYPTYGAVTALLLYFGFRNYRLFIHDKFIIKQSGAWDIANQIIEPSKIQALSVSQLFWHKSADIGYLTIYTAGGNISFQLGNYTIVKDYVNLWLYRMEVSDSNWM